MTTAIKNHRIFHTLSFLGVIVTITLLLFIGATAFHIPGFSQTSFAHAMERGTVPAGAQSLCVSSPNMQNCVNQDPVVQGCDKDAQTVAFKNILDAQGNLLATIERRYSPLCHSEWGRITDNGKQPLLIIVNKNTQSTKGIVAYSRMVFIPNLSVAPQIDGTVSINGIDPSQGGGAGQEAVIPALPPIENQP